MVCQMLALLLVVGTLHGVVMVGPTAPVCRTGQPCKAPAKHMCLLFGGTRVMTDVYGRYRVRLPVGYYKVEQCAPSAIGRGVEPTTVHVLAHRDRHVDLFVDTGIR